jgi:hypothetical protein
MLQFFHGHPSPDLFSFEPSIFNMYAHLRLQCQDGWDSFYAFDSDASKVIAVIHFHSNDQMALSPLSASFGGLELSDVMSSPQIAGFVEFFTGKLKSIGIKQVVVKQSPFIQDDVRVLNSFLNAGFKIQLTEVDSFVKVEGDYVGHLQERKAKKLRSLKKQNWSFQIKSVEHLAESYDFILECRSAKDYSLSMTWPQMEQLANAFPDRIFHFQVLDGKKIIAASICIQVKSNWLYDFYHDHDSEYDADSPLLLLIQGIYDFCKFNSIQWIELGTSMAGTEVNEGLLEFKKRLGATAVSKMTFLKDL